MKKTSAVFLFLLAIVLKIHAQTELWGTVNNSGKYGYGYLFKTDSNGNNIEIMHHFDSDNGKHPKNLLLASNGKLYGVTSGGGQGNQGVLYEYDITINKFTVKENFGNSSDFANHFGDAEVGLTEGAPGILYGQVATPNGVPASKGAIFTYNIQTNTLALALRIPTFLGGQLNQIQNNSLAGPLFKASDGFLYGTTARNSTCPIGAPSQGSIVRINPANNTLSVLYLNPCSIAEGFMYQSSFIEENGKLYSVAYGGLGAVLPEKPYGNGVIYEFDKVTNAYTNKHFFQDVLTGYMPHPMTQADNGKWYGLAEGGIEGGVIYEYDPATGNVVKKYDFVLGTSAISEVGTLPFGVLTKAGNGKLYGSTSNGIFEYDVSADEVRAAARWPIGKGYYPYDPTIIEICRKPSYAFFSDDGYTLCEGTYFHHDLKCENATSIVWKQNGTIVPSQTGSVLEFASITAAEAGVWVCELTNSCGTTVVPSIQITVNSGGAGVITSTLTPSGTRFICKGSSITLSGNDGGLWNTGESTNSISVSQPGSYQVVNTNDCGVTYSNIVIIDTIPSPVAPVISGYNSAFCIGDSIEVSGNTNGVWNTGATSYSIYVKVPGRYFVVTTNQCTSDTSNIGEVLASSIHDPLSPKITGDTVVCQGGSVALHANNINSTWVFNSEDGNSYGVGFGLTIQASEQGDYRIFQSNMGCGSFSSSSFHLDVVPGPPPIPVITASGPLTFCEGESLELGGNISDGVWNTGDSAQTITVVTSGTYYLTSTNICGTSASEEIVVTVNPLPVIDYQQVPTSVCINDADFPLSEASPAGGIYSGTAVTGTTFSPSAAGSGNHVITYSLTDAHGCSAIKTQIISVLSSSAAVVQSNSGTNSFCEGGNLLLYQVQFPEVNWSTGATASFILVNEPGVYNYSVSTPCGILTSNSISVTEIPAPDITVTQTGTTLESNAANATYQWIDCSNNNSLINGETNKTFTASGNGSYAVIVTSNYCSKTSPCYPMIITDIQNSMSSTGISLFPNPAHDQLELLTEEEILSVTVLSLTGQHMLRENSRQLNISSIPSGSYFLLVETPKGIWREKFAKL